jgi:hypothetical protein
VTRRGSIWIGVAIVAALAGAASANLLQNAGFENSSAGGAAADNWWSYSGPGSPGDTAYVGAESWASRSGTNGMVLKAWNGNGIFGGYGQDVATNLSVGDVITFSIYGSAEPEFTSTTSEAWLKMEFWNGASKSYESQLSVYGGLTGARDSWNQYTFILTNNVAGITTIKPIVGWGNNSTNGWVDPINAAVKWDDADLTVAGAIPEPTVAALLGLAGLLLTAVRRRARK